MGTGSADINGAEVAGLLARLAHALLAVVGHDVTGDRAVLAGSVYHLYHKVVACALGVVALGKADSLPHDLPFLVDAAAIARLGTGHHAVGQLVLFRLKFSGKHQLCDFAQDLVFDLNDRTVVGNHMDLLIISSRLRLLQRTALSHPVKNHTTPQVRRIFFYYSIILQICKDGNRNSSGNWDLCRNVHK